MTDMIESVHEFFKCQKFPKPRRVTSLFGPDGNLVTQCPFCKEIVDIQDCDVLGAEPDCCFCLNCNRELQYA